MLDLVAAMTSLGSATHQIANDPLREAGLSQVFVAIDPRSLGDEERTEVIADGVFDSLHAARPLDQGSPVRYPGENTLRLREENRRLGLPVDEAVWEQIGRI